jgi:RNA polymerase sigma-70 factor, ECF subfamily
MTVNQFHAILLDIGDDLEKFAYSLTLEKTDAEDLVQETFLKALLNKDKYVIHENFKAWVFTIMRNTNINSYRRSIYKQLWRDESMNSFFLNQMKFVSPDDPDTAYNVSEMTQHIEKLKETFRIPLEMYIHGYKYREIADKLNLNIGTIKSRIHLSRKRLMDQLNG